jgi:hypothetical protein
MFAQLALEARRTERAMRDLLRTVDAARIGVVWSGPDQPEWLEPAADGAAVAHTLTELTGN